MSHPSNKVTVENLKDVVYWHKPSMAQIDDMEQIAKACEILMGAILLRCPDCADRDVALAHARSARMWANASIALDPNLDPKAEIDHDRKG